MNEIDGDIIHKTNKEIEREITKRKGEKEKETESNKQRVKEN